MSDERTRWPFDQIRTGGGGPMEGFVTFEIEALQKMQSKGSNHLMISATFRAIDPPQFIGRPTFENYVIGRPNDPEAKDPNTWTDAGNFGARLFAELMQKAKVACTGYLEDDCAAAVGAKIVFETYQEQEPEKLADGSDNPYAYRTLDNGDRVRRSKTKVRGMYPVGSQPGVATRERAARPGTPLVKCPQCNKDYAAAGLGDHLLKAHGA